MRNTYLVGPAPVFMDLYLPNLKVLGISDPTPAEKHAEDELVHWTGKISAGGDAPEQRVILRRDESMGSEEFSIIPECDDLAITGGAPRGVLYGVYELLDRFGGIRWLTPDDTYLPSKHWVTVPEQGIAHSPVLDYREPYYTEAFDGDWAARNRANSNRAELTEVHGGKVTYVGFVHTFNRLVPPGEFFSTHPEYFSEIDGKRIAEKTQLCLTNEEVVEIAAKRAIQWLDENPGADIISVSQNDWRNPCQCSECSRLDEEEGSHAGSLLHFVNRVAERIEERYPDKLVDTLAYQYTRKAPKSIRPRRNVVVRLCSIECCFSHPLAECPENRDFRRDTEDWARAAHTLHVWDYVTNFRHYVMPFPNLRVLQPNVDFFVNNSVKGIFEEGNYSEGGGGELASLRSYLLAKILWNPSCDVDQAMEDFLSNRFGRAAASVRSYIDLLHDTVEGSGVHVRIYDDPDSFLDGDFVRDSLKILDEAEGLAGDERERGRVRRMRLPVVYSEIFMMEDGDEKRSRMMDFLEECRSFGLTNISERYTIDQFIEEVVNSW